MPTSTVENYVKQLYLEQQQQQQQRGPEQLVSMGKLATVMGVVPGTATTMMKALADSGLGRRLRVARVIDQDPGFLQFVERCGLLPGTAVTVEARNPQADSVAVHPHDRRPVTLGTAAAGKILVEEV